MGALKHSGPLLGYNNNVPYKGQVFHVQTEDSGSKRPHVITHLFADGGRIVKTTKTSYAHYLDSDNLTDRVRALMREQHKGMVIALRDGNLDPLIDEGRAEIEEKTAPDATKPELEAAADKANDALALLERAAAVDDREFYREMEQLVPPSQPPPAPKQITPAADRSAGAYSFVGRSSGPPRKSEPPPRLSPLPASVPGRALPPRRMRSTKPPNEEDGLEDAPPAIDVAGAKRRNRRTRDGPPESEDRPTSVYQRGSSSQRTDPDLEGARDHAVAVSNFGSRFIGSSRFDELVLAFFSKGG